MKTTIFHSNDHTDIIISDPDINLWNVKKNSNTFTLPSLHNTSVAELNLLTTYLMTSAHQNNHEQFTCEQSWHSSEPANYYSFEVTYTQETLILKQQYAHYA